MKSFVSGVDVSFPYDGFMKSTVTMEVYGVVNSKELMNLDFDQIIPGKVIVKCVHCGQYAARKTACVHCGAPVD
jgi:rRNA maturation endonuclease Nob1